jgi:murein DD-endopeptidase MepM/ murein hydrolase activator NlpD
MNLAVIATAGIAVLGTGALALSVTTVGESVMSHDPAGSGRTLAAVSTPAPGRYVRPLAGDAEIVRAFSAPAQHWSAGHRGVDLAAPDGAEVLAPAAGVVTFAGTVVDRGVVTVSHADGLRSTVEPVEPSVRPGQPESQGDVIGHLQPGHCPGRTCLHWGVRRGEDYVDPTRLLRAPGPTVLLPLPRARADG